jgi:hypothetical protein
MAGGGIMSRDNDDTDLTTLSRQAHASLHALGLGATFTLADLHERIQAHRSRQIHLIPRQVPAFPHGLWVAGESADYLFYDRTGGTVRAHQIIGHEYGHMLYDDAATSVEMEEIIALLMPTVDPAVIGTVMARTTYDPFRERRAEVFATIVAQRAEMWSVIPRQRVADPEVLARMIATLEGGSGT